MIIHFQDAFLETLYFRRVHVGMSVFAKRPLTTLVSSNSLECSETGEHVISKSMVMDTLHYIWKQGGMSSSNRQRMMQQLLQQVWMFKKHLLFVGILIPRGLLVRCHVKKFQVLYFKYSVCRHICLYFLPTSICSLGTLGTFNFES